MDKQRDSRPEGKKMTGKQQQALKLEEMLKDLAAAKDIQVVTATDAEVDAAMQLILEKYDLEHRLLR